MRSAVAPWFLALFIPVWIACLVYVATIKVTIVRIRRLTGEASGPDDWLHVIWRPQIKYLGWIFSGKHRAVGDPLLSRLVIAVRVLFICLVPAVLTMFALAPLGASSR